MRVTIKDIAREAGVSVTTVSRVLNNKADVSDKTREKVLKIIDKMNYNPNSIARGLVTPFLPRLPKPLKMSCGDMDTR